MEEGSFKRNGEADQLSAVAAPDSKKRGGWITSPFITATLAGLTLAAGGWINYFKIPAGSMIIFMIVSTSLSVIFLDRSFYPTWQKITGRFPPPLQRIGIGHVICMISMAVAAIVEQNRLKMAHNISANSVVPMSVIWLVPQLALVGIGEAFHFPGYIALYYQEFPAALKSTATAMADMTIAIAFYLSTALVGMVRSETRWLPNDVNEGRMDNMYWVLFGLGGVNFVYYLVCASFYKYLGLAKLADENKA